MSKSMYELWMEYIKSTGVYVYPLERVEGRSETGLFLINYFPTPIYYVWVDGKHFETTMSYLEALSTYRNAIRMGTV